jgi:GT2 family glycosyltransferase
MASTCHPFSGYLKTEVPTNLCIPVDLLATRFMLTPAQAIIEGGLVSERLLPHYHADLEFSHRLHRAGYVPYIYTKARIEVDTNNTGDSVYFQTIGFWTRVFRLMSIRNPSNPWYRMVFVVLVFPWYSWPTATLAYLLRTLIEVALNKAQIQACFGTKGRGYAN